MQVLKLAFLISCFTVIATCESVESSDIEFSNDGEVEIPSDVAKIIQEVINDLEDHNKQIEFLKQRLQENVVDVVNEGREELYKLKKNIQNMIEKDEVSINCGVGISSQLKEFEKQTKAELTYCSANVFKYSEEYRHRIIDDIAELKAGIVELRRMVTNCFTTNDPNICYYDTTIEYNRIANEIRAGFEDMYKDAEKNAIDILSDVMECNKEALKKARTKQNELRDKLVSCCNKE